MLNDKTNLKILSELDKNSRISYTDLGRNIKLTKQAIKHRLDKLIQARVISHFLTIVNIGKIGYTSHKIFFSFHNLSNEKRKEIIKYLRNNKFVGAFALCDGPYDLYLGIITKTCHDLNRELSKFYNLFSEQIKSKKVATIVKAEFYNRDYLTNKERKIGEKKKWFCSKVEKAKDLKPVDKKILTYLVRSPRTSFATIARRLETSTQNVSNRIKFLEENQIIEGHTISLNEKKFDFIHHKILLEFSSTPEAVEIPNITYFVKTFGEWDYEFNIETKSFDEYRKIIEDFKKLFSPYLKNFTPLLINHVPKFKYIPNFKNQ